MYRVEASFINSSLYICVDKQKKIIESFLIKIVLIVPLIDMFDTRP